MRAQLLFVLSVFGAVLAAPVPVNEEQPVVKREGASGSIVGWRREPGVPAKKLPIGDENPSLSPPIIRKPVLCLLRSGHTQLESRWLAWCLREVVGITDVRGVGFKRVKEAGGCSIDHVDLERAGNR
ncbi:hypothetical protein AN958_06379 [Leucoagaricus sp. SymC.cos]|nr:hypothetical protein AN958_06379 [Leucoagaricus sp. SymC.cos]